MTPIVVYLPLRLVSEANNRDHWAKRSARAKIQRNATRMVVAARFAREGIVPLKAISAWGFDVLITRIGKRILDTDNLARSAKACRDGIADAMRIDDADPRVTWCYSQSTTKGRYEVRIEIRARESAKETA